MELNAIPKMNDSNILSGWKEQENDKEWDRYITADIFYFGSI